MFFLRQFSFPLFSVFSSVSSSLQFASPSVAKYVSLCVSLCLSLSLTWVTKDGCNWGPQGKQPRLVSLKGNEGFTSRRETRANLLSTPVPHLPHRALGGRQSWLPVPAPTSPHRRAAHGLQAKQLYSQAGPDLRGKKNSTRHISFKRCLGFLCNQLINKISYRTFEQFSSIPKRLHGHEMV